MLRGVRAHRALEDFDVGVGGVVVPVNGVTHDGVVSAAITAAASTATFGAVGGGVGEIAPHVVSTVGGGEEVGDGVGAAIQRRRGGGSGCGGRQGPGCGRELRVRVQVHPRQRRSIEAGGGGGGGARSRRVIDALLLRRMPLSSAREMQNRKSKVWWARRGRCVSPGFLEGSAAATQAWPL